MASRRQFLQSTGIAGTFAVAGFVVGRLTAGNEKEEFLDPRLEALVAAGTFSPILGATYLKDTGTPTISAYKLLIKETMRGLSPNNLPSDIRNAIDNDFRQNNLCQLQGWQLSLTECRVAGIAFLYQHFGGHVEEPRPPRGLLDRLPDATLAGIDRWGPTSTRVNEPFNRRPDGGSAIWMHLDDIPEHADYQIYFGSQAAASYVNREQLLLTGSLTAKQATPLLSQPGKIDVYLADALRGKQFVGHIDVSPHPDKQRVPTRIGARTQP